MIRCATKTPPILGAPDGGRTAAVPSGGQGWARWRGERSADMSAKEKAKAQAEQIAGKAVRKASHARGDKTTEAKGAALESRGKARGAKEKGKDAFKR